MSHKNSTLELVEGVNVITGPNNSGKSAIISALQILSDLPAREGDYMVRHGENESEITVTTGEDHEICWRRSGSTTSLTINGEKFTRLHNNREHYLAKVHSILRLPKVAGKENQDDFDIHFGTQKQPLFLINEPPSRSAVFFASSSDAGRLTEIRDKYKEMVSSKKKDREKASLRLLQQEAILSKLAPLDELESKIQFVKNVYTTFTKLQAEYDTLANVLSEARKASKQVEKESMRKNAFANLQQPPEMADLAGLESFIKEYMLLTSQRKQWALRLQALDALSLENMPCAVEEIQIQECKKIIDALKDATNQCRNSSSRLSCTDNLQPYPVITDVQPLRTLILEYTEQLKRKQQLSQKLREAIKAQEDFIEQNPLCPLCGSNLAGDICYA